MIDPPANNTEWIKRAFFHVQATLLGEIVTHSGDYLSEDLIRSAMLRGLILTHPVQAGRVQAEMPALAWTNNAPWDGQDSPANESPCRHDVGVAPISGANPGILCEVKWLKQAQTSAVIQDIWKLALSRGVADEKSCPNTFLLIGGEHAPFSTVLTSLQKSSLNFRWSSAGRRTSKKPEPKTLNLERGLTNREAVCKAAATVLNRGTSGLRTPPECVQKLRLSVRHVWHESVGNRSWTVVLWEMDHRGVKDGIITWADHKQALADALAKPKKQKPQSDERTQSS